MISEVIVSIIFGVCVGVAATATMDLLATYAQKLGITVGAKGQWVGRWYLGIARGRFHHSNIEDYPEQPGEKRAALIGHYLIGVTLAVFYFVGADLLGIPPGSAPAALGYGLLTNVFPWFLLFPALGFGFFGLQGRPELRLFRTSLINHLFYGFGLWWASSIIDLAQQLI